MKPWLLYFIMLLSWSNMSGQNITKVTIISVPLSITYSWDINCKEFDRTFNDIKKTIILTSTSKIEEMKLALSKFKVAELTGIDVRGKLLICHNGKNLKVACFDEFGDFYVDGNFYENKKLFNFLLANKFITWQ